MSEALPPEDAENWSDDEWIEWLERTDEDGAAQPYVPTKAKPQSLPGQMLGAAMMGLHEVFYGKRQEKQVQIAPAPGPPEDEDVEIVLDPDEPSNSEVRFKRG